MSALFERIEIAEDPSRKGEPFTFALRGRLGAVHSPLWFDRAEEAERVALDDMKAMNAAAEARERRIAP